MFSSTAVHSLPLDSTPTPSPVALLTPALLWFNKLAFPIPIPTCSKVPLFKRWICGAPFECDLSWFDLTLDSVALLCCPLWTWLGLPFTKREYKILSEWKGSCELTHSQSSKYHIIHIIPFVGAGAVQWVECLPLLIPVWDFTSLSKNYSTVLVLNSTNLNNTSISISQEKLFSVSISIWVLSSPLLLWNREGGESSSSWRQKVTKTMQLNLFLHPGPPVSFSFLISVIWARLDF